MPDAIRFMTAMPQPWSLLPWNSKRAKHFMMAYFVFTMVSIFVEQLIFDLLLLPMAIVLWVDLMFVLYTGQRYRRFLRFLNYPSMMKIKDDVFPKAVKANSLEDLAVAEHDFMVAYFLVGDLLHIWVKENDPNA